MSIPLTGSEGLFTRVGKMGGLLNAVNDFRGATTIGSKIDLLEAEFHSTDQDLADNLYTTRDTYRRVHASFVNFLKRLAQRTVVRMAEDDMLMPSPQLALALETVITQMLGSGDTVQQPTISAVVTPGGSNHGDGVLVASVLGPNGIQRDYLFNETVGVSCTSDSQHGTAEGSEGFVALGQQAQTDVLNFDWPQGSGASASLQAIDGGSVVRNLLRNSDFETFTVANTPDNWTLNVGVAGTDIFKESSTVYSGSAALKFTGTGGGPLSEIYQALTTLQPDTVYAVNVWLRKTAGLLAGVLQFDLHDGTAVIADDAATDNALSVAFNAAGLSSAGWTAFNAFFRTPAVMPDTVRFRVKATTALTSGESFLIDRLAFAPATELYAAGPFLAVFSGATKFIDGDTFSLAVSNAYDSAWELLAERFFSMRTLGLQLPSSGSPSISDSLIS